MSYSSIHKFQFRSVLTFVLVSIGYSLQNFIIWIQEFLSLSCYWIPFLHFRSALSSNCIVWKFAQCWSLSKYTEAFVSLYSVWFLFHYVIFIIFRNWSVRAFNENKLAFKVMFILLLFFGYFYVIDWLSILYKVVYLVLQWMNTKNLLTILDGYF